MSSEMMPVTELGRVLENAETYESRESIFLPMDEAWGVKTPTVVADLDEIDDPASEAVNANDRTYEYALGLDTLVDVVVNAQQQIEHPTVEQLLQAFLYYYDNDAFIDF